MSKERTLDTSTRTIVRINPDGVDVEPLLPEGSQSISTSMLDNVIEVMQGISAEMEQINPNHHPVKYEVLQRWRAALQRCEEQLKDEAA